MEEAPESSRHLETDHSEVGPVDGAKTTSATRLIKPPTATNSIPEDVFSIPVYAEDSPIARNLDARYENLKTNKKLLEILEVLSPGRLKRTVLNSVVTGKTAEQVAESIDFLIEAGRVYKSDSKKPDNEIIRLTNREKHPDPTQFMTAFRAAQGLSRGPLSINDFLGIRNLDTSPLASIQEQLQEMKDDGIVHQVRIGNSNILYMLGRYPPEPGEIDDNQPTYEYTRQDVIISDALAIAPDTSSGVNSKLRTNASEVKAFTDRFKEMGEIVTFPSGVKNRDILVLSTNDLLSMSHEQLQGYILGQVAANFAVGEEITLKHIAESHDVDPLKIAPHVNMLRALGIVEVEEVEEAESRQTSAPLSPTNPRDKLVLPPASPKVSQPKIDDGFLERIPGEEKIRDLLDEERRQQKINRVVLHMAGFVDENMSNRAADTLYKAGMIKP